MIGFGAEEVFLQIGGRLFLFMLLRKLFGAIQKNSGNKNRKFIFRLRRIAAGRVTQSLSEERAADVENLFRK